MKNKHDGSNSAKDVASILMWEFFGDISSAASYCDGIVSENGPLAGLYANARTYLKPVENRIGSEDTNA